MKIKIFYFFLVFTSVTSQLLGKMIDIIANFDLEDLPISWHLFNRDEVEVRTLKVSFPVYLENFYSTNVEKVILMNEMAHVDLLPYIPKEKLILFLWEPRPISVNYCSLFSQVYTFNDAFVNNQSYFKFHYPFYRKMIPNKTGFSEKKFCTLVAGNWTRERIKVTSSFIRNAGDDFEFWGWIPGPFENCPRYRGKMPGEFSSDLKRETLNGYRFCICFENSKIPGYVTEKIFDCFAAGCIPIYWGAPNIKKYIPENCFIDYELFLSDEALYLYLKNMSEEEYQQYIDSISNFLESDLVRNFSPSNFESLIYKFINE